MCVDEAAFMLSSIIYTQGPVSAYFTVFAGSYLPVHVSKIEKADGVYERNVGTHLLKVWTDIKIVYTCTSTSGICPTT